MSNTIIQPPAGMRFREYKGVTYREPFFWREGHHFRYAHEVLREWSSTLFDDDHAPLMALKQNPLEPAPPEPVARDATWKAVSGLVDRVWHVAKSYERYGNMDAFPAWEGTDTITDEILRLVRAATPRDPRIVRVLDGWYNVDPWGAHFHPTSDAARQAANPREALHTGVRLAVVTEDAETPECPDCAHHRADREAVLAACDVSEQTEDTLAAQVRAAIAQGTPMVRPTATLSTGATILDPQWRWVGDALETRYPDESTWKPALSIPVDRLHEILAMRHAPAEPRGVE